MSSDTPDRDPFEALAFAAGRQQPRSRFTRDLRARLVTELGLDPEPPSTIDLPDRKRLMSTTTSTATNVATVTPYLAARDATGALAWYGDALGAIEQFRVVGDDGKLGHAEFTIGDARFMLSDEYPDLGVHAPQSLGGTTTTLHLEVGDVDEMFARAVAAGATSLGEPADQPHGARHGTLTDPYGHRWMLSQTIEDLDLDEYATRADGSGFTVQAPSGTSTGGIWAEVSYADALEGIRFLTQVFGFEEQLVVPDDDDPSVVVHSQIRWPEGGILQVGTFVEGNEFLHRPGDQSLYVVTADPQSVWERCQVAGLDVIRAPEAPHYDPEGMGFSVRDREGNIWSFGTYGGEG